MTVPAPDSTLVQRANLNIAAAVMAKSGPNVSDSLLGHAINEIRASHSVVELAGANNMPMVVSAVEVFLARNAEADRPRNLYGAEAAQLAAQSGQHGGHWQHEVGPSGRYGLLLAGRGSRAVANDGGDESASGGGNSRSSVAANGTGGEPVGAAFWGTAKGMLLTRSYANDNDMNWAPPDLMKMGRPALQALKESGLKGDGYKALRDPSGLRFNNSTVLSGAAYMKRNHLNYNEAGKAADKLYRHPLLNSEDREEVRGASEQAAKAGADEAKGAAAKARIGRAQTRLKENCPEAAKEIDNWAKKYGGDKEAGLDAKATAQKNDAVAKKDDATAKQKDAKANADDRETNKKNDEMAALLRNRPKPSSPAPGN